MSEQDLAISLPTDTSTFSAVGMLPVGKLDDCHALILADDVAPEEVEALAMSQDAQAGWVGASRLQLSPGVELQGPWPVDADLRRLMNLPEWASQIMILECEPQRGGPLPPELTGIDPMADAFPQAQPEGAELLALVRLRAIARRLAGALLLRGDPAHPNGATRVSRRRRSILVQPDPSSSVNLDVYAPVWLTPDATQTLLARVLPGATQRLEPMAGSGAAGLSEMDQAQLERLTELIGADALDRAWRQAEERRRKREAEIARAAGGPERLPSPDAKRPSDGVTAPPRYRRSTPGPLRGTSRPSCASAASSFQLQPPKPSASDRDRAQATGSSPRSRPTDM